MEELRFKYHARKFGDAEAIFNVLSALGEEVIDRLANGELTARLESGVVIVSPALRALFVKTTGRWIPTRGTRSAVRDPSQNFRLVQPDLKSAPERMRRWCAENLEAAMSPGEFASICDALLEEIGESGQARNALSGVHLPILIPQMRIGDLGETTERLVSGVARSYQQQFPGRQFYNHRQGQLKGQVTQVQGTGYQRLLDALYKGPVAGIFFPNPLQGFSVLAQREQVPFLPQGFSLAGPIETSIAWAMWPDVLARDFYTPVADCSAVQWQSPELSLHFNASGADAYFASRASLADPYDCYSGGLLFSRL